MHINDGQYLFAFVSGGQLYFERVDEKLNSLQPNLTPYMCFSNFMAQQESLKLLWLHFHMTLISKGSAINTVAISILCNCKGNCNHFPGLTIGFLFIYRALRRAAGWAGCDGWSPKMQIKMFVIKLTHHYIPDRSDYDRNEPCVEIPTISSGILVWILNEALLFPYKRQQSG